MDPNDTAVLDKIAELCAEPGKFVYQYRSRETAFNMHAEVRIISKGRKSQRQATSADKASVAGMIGGHVGLSIGNSVKCGIRKMTRRRSRSIRQAK